MRINIGRGPGISKKEKNNSTSFLFPSRPFFSHLPKSSRRSVRKNQYCGRQAGWTREAESRPSFPPPPPWIGVSRDPGNTRVPNWLRRPNAGPHLQAATSFFSPLQFQFDPCGKSGSAPLFARMDDPRVPILPKDVTVRRKSMRICASPNGIKKIPAKSRIARACAEARAGKTSKRMQVISGAGTCTSRPARRCRWGACSRWSRCASCARCPRTHLSPRAATGVRAWASAPAAPPAREPAARP